MHHSFNLPSQNRYDFIFQNRISFLIKNEISLFAYHFLLDAHPEVGNNIQILKTIGANPSSSYFHKEVPWGWIGEFEKAVESVDIISRLEKFLSKRAVIYPFGSGIARRVVAVSGSGAPYSNDFYDLQKAKVDFYITGEVYEWNRELFKEAKINFIAIGHYLSEVFGIKALMGKVKEQFPKLGIEWIDVYNEV